jgi:hypothetical protein
MTPARRSSHGVRHPEGEGTSGVLKKQFTVHQTGAAPPSSSNATTPSAAGAGCWKPDL